MSQLPTSPFPKRGTSGPGNVLYILAVKKAGHLNIKTKMASDYSQRVFANQPTITRASRLFLC